MGGKHLKKLFAISYKLKSNLKQFSTHIFIQYLSNVKSLFADYLRAEPTTFSTEKYYFLWNFYLVILWAILH